MTTTIDIKRRFFNSLKRGTGEAYLIAKEYPTIDFSTYIIKGALRNYAYDGQCESSRAQYLFDIILLSDNKEKFRKAIFKGLATEQSDTWSLTQLFDITKLFAQHSDNEARNAIYDRFLNNPIEGSDWVGYEQILELDGLNGLKYIAEKFGRYIEKYPDVWQDDHIIRHFQDDNPDINVLQELDIVSKSNKFIKLYLDYIHTTEENRKNHIREKQTYSDIIDEVINSKPVLSYRRRKELNQTELTLIAEQLLKEKSKLIIEKLLHVFTLNRFPLNSEFILNLAKQKVSSSNRIKEFAIYSLKFLKSDDIRNFALTKIPIAKNPVSYINILVSNYKHGDNKLLTKIANKFKSEHIIESLAGSYVEIYRANRTKECKEPLEVLYNKLNCGICRNSIVELLIDNNVISDKIKKEIQYDSNLETRKLIAIK